MKYVAPYGSSDPNAPYVNGNPSTGQQGSIPPAAAFEHPLRELVALISASGMTPDESVLTQVLQAIRSGALNWKLVGGTANDLTVDLTPDLAAYTAGLPLNLVTGPNPNTGAMTINVDGRGAKALLRRGGEAMTDGDIPASSLLEVVYDGAAFRSVGLVRSDVAAMPLGAKLPIYADVRTSDGRLTVTPGAGNVVVTGATIRWRGWQDYDLTGLSAGNRTFTTAASKTYHLRWDAPGTGLATPAGTYPLGRLSLRDLADGAYNPSSLTEGDVAFDTSHDSILIAKVVTNGANAATVTALANKPRLTATGVSSGAGSALSPNYLSTYAGQLTLNWGRAPSLWTLTGYVSQAGGGVLEYANTLSKDSGTRYALAGTVASNWNESYTGGGGTPPTSIVGTVMFDAIAA